MKVTTLFSLAVGVVLATTSARAQVTASALIGPNNTFPVLATDLADTSQGGTLSFTGTEEFFSSAAKVIDGGVYGPSGSFVGTEETLSPSVGSELILNLAPSATGWDIDRIMVLTGVADGQVGRSDHSYTIALSTDGTTFGAPIINVNSSQSPLDSGREVQVTINDSGGAPLGTGIKAIKFVFGNVDGFEENMYREIDVVMTNPTLTLLTGPNNTFPVLTTDLADTSQGGTLSFTGTANFGSNPAKVTDGGVYGPSGLFVGTEETLAPSVGSELILNLAPSATGWDIDRIVVLTGVADGQEGRSDHSYTIALSTDGINFSAPIINVNSSPPAPAGGREVQATINDSRGAPLGTGIKAIKFVFGNADGFLENMYREIDVVAFAPEALTFLLNIVPNGVNPGNYDFTWTSQTGKVYDLVTSTDLATPVSSWPVWDGKSGIPASEDGTNELLNIPGGGDTRRFFAVVERNP